MGGGYLVVGFDPLAGSNRQIATSLARRMITSE